MLNKAKNMKGYALHCLDGQIGAVNEFYFDDDYWTVRYLVVDTGNWLMGRQVLISPYAVLSVNQEDDYITVQLSKQQIEDSPALESHKPVSRQFEQAYYGYYGWPMYWDGPYMWGASPYLMRDSAAWQTAIQDDKTWDPHLRSTKEMSGYHIQASDGDIGHIEDFIIEDDSWTIRYFIINTNNWWSGKQVLISPQWIERISWDESTVFVGLSREIIRQSPEFTDESELNRDYEIGLHRLYDRKGYWVDETGAKNKSL